MSNQDLVNSAAPLIVQQLIQAKAYDHPVGKPIEVIETHISWVFLAGEYAYKLKKPLRNPFLDYTTLKLRQHFCHEELRLNRQFAPELYIDVVSINAHAGQVRVNGPGAAIDYAVRMRRFAKDSLLSERLASGPGTVTLEHVRALAIRISDFHQRAPSVALDTEFGSPELVLREALDNFDTLQSTPEAIDTNVFARLRDWTNVYFLGHQQRFRARRDQGHIRQCHGDLHLGNIVWWHNQFVPFDSIEFCESFHCIDTLSDAGFTAMDFAHRGRIDFSRSFINAYFESSGDYAAVDVLNWYLVYRAMVRAKVAGLRCGQTDPASDHHRQAQQEAISCQQLAGLLARLPGSTSESPPAVGLWMTHGLSGSGKSFGAEKLAQQFGLIRIRADVERKRLAHQQSKVDLYTSEMTSQTYHHLAALARQVLAANLGVIIDAACLCRWQRQLFLELAESMGVPCTIASFTAPVEILRERIRHRLQSGGDPSDADESVLQWQVTHQEPLTESEQCLTKIM